MFSVLLLRLSSSELAHQPELKTVNKLEPITVSIAERERPEAEEEEEEALEEETGDERNRDDQTKQIVVEKEIRKLVCKFFRVFCKLMLL